MSREILITSSGDLFRAGNITIPKSNTRRLAIKDDAIVSDERTMSISVSSEQPFNRSWYYEILEHSKDAVNLERFNDGAMCLYNHKSDNYLGVIEKAWLDGGKLYSKIRFDEHELAEQIVRSINNRIVRNVSIGYLIDELVLFKESKDGFNTYKATKWTPYEASFVTVPADSSVGVGRQYFDFSANIDKESTFVEKKLEEPEKEGASLMTSEAVDRERAIKDEQTRCQNILAGGSRWNCPELAQKAVEENWSVEAFHSEVLSRQGVQKPVAKTNEPLGMEKKERQRYRISRVLRAIVDNGWAENCFEKEVHDSLVKQAKKNKNYTERGFFSVKIPYQELPVDREAAGLVRSQQVGSAVLGGNLVETELAEQNFITIFRNKSVMRRMGMRSITGLTANLDIPKHTKGVVDGQSIYWVGEDVDVGKIESEFGLVQFRPKIAGSYMYVTRSMLIQSSIPMDNFIREELAIAMALGMDWTALRGSGVGDEPLGLLNLTGTNPVIFGINGDFPTWAKLVQFETKIASANADERTMGWVMNPKLRGELKSRPKFENTSNETLWVNANNGMSNEGYVNGYRVGVSNQVPADLTKGTGTNLNAAVFGDFSRWICAEWGTMELAADPYFKFLSGGVRVRIIHEMDMNATQPTAFAVATDVATPLSDSA